MLFALIEGWRQNNVLSLFTDIAVWGGLDFPWSRLSSRAEKGLRVTWWRVVLSTLGCKKVYVEEKKKTGEQRNQSLFKEKSPRILHRTQQRQNHQHGSRRRRGCGLLWSCAAASLRCNASRARSAFPCGDPAGTRRRRWVTGRFFHSPLWSAAESRLLKTNDAAQSAGGSVFCCRRTRFGFNFPLYSFASQSNLQCWPSRSPTP